MDLALYALIVLLFGAWTTVHLLLCIKIFKKDWRKATAGFFAFPLAPYFGLSLKVKGLPIIWVAIAALYMVALLAGTF